MNKLKSILLLLLLISSSYPLFSYDFGLTVDTSGTFEESPEKEIADPSWTVKNAFWANSRIREYYTVEFQSSYTITDEDSFFMELDQLQFSGKIPIFTGNLSFKAGRLPFSDFSGKVFSHTGDGLQASLGLGDITFSAFGTYTGFLQASSSSITMSLADESVLAKKSDGYFGPLGVPRVIEGIRVSLTGIPEGQTLIFSGIFQQDLHDKADITTGNRVNSIYGGAGLIGTLSPRFIYNAFGYGNFGTIGDDTIMAYLAGGGINYLIPTFYSSRLALDIQYASGDKDYESFYEGNSSGDSLIFLPVTASPAGMVFTPQQSNIFHVAGTYSFKPFENSVNSLLKNLLVLTKPILFFRSTTGPISTGGVDPESEGLYLGTEIDAALMARLYSDLGLSMNGGVYIPSDEMEDKDLRMKISLSLSLSL